MSITAQRLQAVLDAGLFYQRRVGALRNAISVAAARALASGLVDPTIHGLMAEFMTPEWVGQEHGHSLTLVEEAVRIGVNAKDNARRARQRARQRGEAVATPDGPLGRYLTEHGIAEIPRTQAQAQVQALTTGAPPVEDPDEGGQMEEWMTARAKWEEQQRQTPGPEADQ